MFKCILIAIDVNDAEGATRLMSAARSLMQSADTVFHVLNVVPETGMAMVGSMLGPNHSAEIMETAKRLVEDWAQQTIPAEINAHLHVSQGTIYDRIIKAADEVGADAIVVGAHRPGLQDYLIGPNSARVARHARQSVFVIR